MDEAVYGIFVSLLSLSTFTAILFCLNYHSFKIKSILGGITLLTSSFLDYTVYSWRLAFPYAFTINLSSSSTCQVIPSRRKILKPPLNLFRSSLSSLNTILFHLKSYAWLSLDLFLGGLFFWHYHKWCGFIKFIF